MMSKKLVMGLMIGLALAAMGLAGWRGSATGAIAAPDTGSPWKRYDLSGTNLYAVDAAAGTDVWAVGSDGVLAHWDGTTWLAYDNAKIGSPLFYSVDALATNFAWAVGTGGAIYRWDGTAWVQESTNFAGTPMYDISMNSYLDGWTVGQAGTYAHYNGSTWQAVIPGGTLTSTMYSLDVLNINTGWAVGGYQSGPNYYGKIARWNGATWQDVTPAGLNRILYAVDMLDANYGWAGGLGGVLWQWNGSTWTSFPTPSAAVTVKSVSVWSTTNAWAVGATNIYTNNLWHWDGTSWTAVATPNGAPLQGITIHTPLDGWAVGDRGTIYHYDGTNWTLSNTRWTTNGYYGLDFLNPTDGWAVGVLNAQPPAYGLQHWDGTTWTTYQPPSFAPTMYDVGMVATNAVWAVGTSGYIFRWDGAQWTRDTSPVDAHLYAVSMLAANNGWAVGSDGRIVHYDGTAWTNYTSNTTTNLWSIDMVDANEGWAGGTLGLMLHYQNGTWTAVNPNPAAYTIEGIHMLSATDGWAVGYNGTILHYQGGTWTAAASPTTARLLNVHMINANEGWAVGEAPTGSTTATLLHYQGGTWTSVPNPTGHPLRDVYAFDGGPGWAVSEAPGTILQLGSGPFLTPTPGPSSTPFPSATRTLTPGATTPSATATPGGGTSTPTLTPGGPTVTPNPSTVTATATPQPTTCALQFVDVPPGSTFYDYIHCLACRGIVGGYPCGGPGEPCPGPYYRPNTNVTRGQVSKIVSESAGFSDPVPSTQQTFEDVAPGSTFHSWIERLAGRGIIGGYPCGGAGEPCIAPGNRPYFRPNANVTRGQLSKITSGAAGWTETPTGQTFEDAPAGSTFYLTIERMSSRGIISGYPCGSVGEPCIAPGNRPYFRPFNNATRGQMSKIAAAAFFPGCQTPTER